jgi:hypothetical protein
VPTPGQVDRVINMPLQECPTCHVPLCDPSVVVQYQTDLPPIVPSILVSCKRQGKRFLNLARRLWQRSDPQAIPMEALPGG